MAAKREMFCCCAALFLLSLSLLQYVAQGQLIYVDCLRNTTSLSSTFTQNLQTALLNFTSLSAQGTRYAANIVGSSGPDRLYAVFQCRGDLSPELCSECVQSATARLPKRDCPKSVGARIQLDLCFLRYDNESFFVPDATGIIVLCNTGAASKSDQLTISALMDNVTTEAPRQGGYATDSAGNFSAMAECLGYLNEDGCSQCLPNLSYSLHCNGSVGGQVFRASCRNRFEAYSFLETASPAPSPSPAAFPAPPSSSRGASLFLPPGSSPQSHAGLGSNARIAIIIVCVVVGFITIVGALLAWSYRARKTRGVKQCDKKTTSSQKLLPARAQLFSLEELNEATTHFHPTNKLGEGGFGTVYKGTLLDGAQVAIKKLSIGSQQGKQQFLNEVNLITSVQHKNLIKLLGCCVEGSERILVYEYLPNKSLDFFLYGEATEEATERTTLNWSTRYGIIVGMANGLAYLHEEYHTQIIHRDIKPSNILLDQQFNPVISDFGLARLINENATHVNTGVAGTPGYLSPEYVLHGSLSEKVDVYSFGVVCLEIITGKQTLHVILLTWVWENYLEGNSLGLVDGKLGHNFSPEEVIRVVHVALLCMQENPKQRPTMSKVTQWLSGTSSILETPTRPAFLDYSDPRAPLDDLKATFSSSTSFQSTSASIYSNGVQSFSDITEPR